MALVKPKQIVYQFKVKEGIDVPKGASIPVLIDGTGTSADIAIEQVGEVKGEVPVSEGQGEKLQALEAENKTLKDEVEILRTDGADEFLLQEVEDLSEQVTKLGVERDKLKKALEKAEKKAK